MLRQRCGLLSSYFDHLLLLGCIITLSGHLFYNVMGDTHNYYCYSYRRSCVVCRSVGLPRSWACKNGWTDWTDRDAVLVVHSGGPKEPCIRWGPDSTPREGAILRGNGRLL